jgi:hypothetical protein
MTSIRRPLASILLAGIIGLLPAAAYADAACRLQVKKRANETWMATAADAARAAERLETAGQKEAAERQREEVLCRLEMAWRQEGASAALPPMAITLHRRLGRSTAAVQAGLRLLYTLQQKEDLSAKEKAQVNELVVTMSHALRRLRNLAQIRAKPVDCGPYAGRRAGELLLAGPLASDPVVLLRDLDNGDVEVLACAEPKPAAPAAVTPCPGCPGCPTCATCPSCPPPVEAVLGNEPWWLMGSGIAVLVLGGVALGVGAYKEGWADDEYERLTGLELDDEERTPEAGSRFDGPRVKPMRSMVPGVVLIAVGFVATVAGLSWGLNRKPGGSDVQATGLQIGPGGASFAFEF